MRYNYKKLHLNEELGREPYVVKGYKVNGYGRRSACKGMTRIDFLQSYESEEEAVKAHPDLVVDGETNWGCAADDAQLKDVSHIQEDPFDGGSWDRPD